MVVVTNSDAQFDGLVVHGNSTLFQGVAAVGWYLFARAVK
jgi:hypothetical protein